MRKGRISRSRSALSNLIKKADKNNFTRFLNYARVTKNLNNSMIKQLYPKAQKIKKQGVVIELQK